MADVGNELLSGMIRLTPDLMDEVRKRASVLERIAALQPVGRRALSQRLRIPEREIRGLTDRLRDAGFLKVDASGMMLSDKGMDVLVLEQHNLPGGLATSYVRGGVELEATLHEMMSIGEKGNRLKVGKFLDDMGVDIDWLPVPEAYHASLPGLEVTLHPGLERFSREVDAAVPGTYEKVLKLLKLCATKNMSMKKVR